MRRSLVLVGLFVAVTILATAGAATPAVDACATPDTANTSDTDTRVLLTFTNASVAGDCGDGVVAAAGGEVLDSADAAPVLVARVDAAAIPALESTPARRRRRDSLGGLPDDGTAMGSAAATQSVPWGIDRVGGVAA
ncbi:hypothetical protein GJ629_10240, partial [Halapricum sp. CBA1109]